VSGCAFVHCNLLDALSAYRAIATHQIEEELDLIDRAVETVLQDLKVSAQRIEERRAEAGSDFRGARTDTARPLLAAGNPRPNKARTDMRGACARPRLPAVAGEVPRGAPRATPRTR
jgi:hypothetical protein